MIDANYLKDRLEALVLTPSPVGMTERGAAKVADWLEAMGYAVSHTRRGVLSVTLGAGNPKRALAAHIDTLGAMVTGLKDNGRLALRNTGTWAARFAEGARVTVFTDKGEARGTILPLKASGHLYNTEVDTQPADWDNLEVRLDLPCDTREDLVTHGFDIGDIVAVDAQPEFLDNGFIVSRHLDDKAGVACLLTALKHFTDMGTVPDIPVQIMFTISEEVGIGGTHGFGPDVQELVAVDNGVTGPGQATRDDSVTIAFRDRTGPFDLPIARHLVSLCERNGIKHVRDTFRSYRSDSAAAIDAGWDLRVGLACFALDSSHGWERTHIASLTELTKLIVSYIESDLVPLPGQ
ncbi:osmoprotectant NAGGN system M42 family peptidase [Pelagibacterium xiamenense]|uniref:osmoprotectant NAGGN system M42 family peptidase n=1 Tax=Pelagibacterium xiamenense TaxID=2901140 RepID=UPI001E355DFD|nr:osmoprotectant NAGGN system M42 family peptidase [Pelagibacterium xiamenense]MCD7059811.1 osmoprotectant NAGGN system M42 family peptidase [Pelagibacterium xiamenense]